jgi:transcription elongation factor Elf1|tara:strand:+ start:957 stop:1958 length:1002 start_codon:yes stop_codon:yes gene_type:complete
MSSYIDLKFINDVSSRLSLFKKKTDYLFNFRCPHCGDSQKSKTKARAYLYRVKNDMFFKCHNCGQGQNFANFLKFVDPKLYSEYVLERYKGSAPATPAPKFDFKPTKFEDQTILDDLKSISDLSEDHPARLYCTRRKIPKKYFDILHLCDKFMTLVNKVKPDTYKVTKDQPRLIIPFFDTTGKLFAFQGRAFGKEQPKYITIKLDENKQKVYGLERINFAKKVKIVEGPIDSLFLDNCLAAAGADLSLNNKISNEKVLYIFDNEPRNKEIVNRMYKVIEKDYNIVIWPDDIQLKDVNDMIMNGTSASELEDIISKNTYNQLAALTKLTHWKKV